MLSRLARVVRLLPLAVCLAAPAAFNPAPALGEPASPFASLPGRWVGEGRFGVRDNPPESVKCRATYIAGTTADELKQTIRCATAGGSIEVISTLKNDAGKLSGEWKETTHNIEGNLEGQVTPAGFRIQVKSSDLAANMDVIVKANRQIVEIQFFDSSLIGLSLILTKG